MKIARQIRKKKAEAKPSELRPRSEKNRRKIDPKRWKMNEKLVSAVSGRSGSFWVAPRSRGNALGTASGRQVGPSWPPSWPSWPPCWPSWTPSWRPGTTQIAPGAVPDPVSNACISSNGVCIDFSSFLFCRAKAPMCLAYQFLQCFVGFARNSHRTCTSANKP